NDPSQSTNTVPQRQPDRKKHRQNVLRAGLAVVAGRAAGAISRRLHLGGGTSVVGIVAQRIYPEIIEHMAAQVEHGSVIVTGTNGKTTTSGFIAAILRDSGLRVWHNREGSNLMRGVASLFVIRAKPNGRLRRSGKRAISILEIDEATIPQIVKVLEPRVAVFNNLFRDQLDRYGEVDSIISHWRQAISQMPASTTLVLNADDPSIACLGTGFSGKVLYYGIDDPSLDLQKQQGDNEQYQVSDARTCSKCGHEYTYSLRFYSHIGHYHCTNCGLQRPQPDIRVIQVQLDSFDHNRITIEYIGQKYEIIVPLPGLYNAYNALAAITASLAVNTDWQPIITGIEKSKPAFGRGELIQAEDRTIRLLLAKNPTGFNEVLRTLFSEGIARHILFILNDNIADGQDVSWIWDVDFERVVGHAQTLVISGTRALDLAIRLKYAGIPQKKMTIIPHMPLKSERDKRQTRQQRGAHKKPKERQTSPASEPINSQIASSYGLKSALDTALKQTPVGETLFIVPTYTGLLVVHRELEQRGLTPHFWEGKEV
ncbi:MAG TPA: Mur ligase family protein, partial [Ktedonobacteraceae bacterium]